MESRITSPAAWTTASIDDFVNDVAIVWEPHDAKRSPIDVWMRVVQHASSLGELVRREQYDAAKKQLGHIAIWMLTFVARCTKDQEGFNGLFRLRAPLSTLLWTKYPNCCAACFTRKVISGSADDWKGQPRECDCILVLAETEERNQRLTPSQKAEAAAARRDYAINHENEFTGFSLKELEDRLNLIFKRNIFALDLEKTTFHFLEEVGEVVEAMTKLYTYTVPADAEPRDLKNRWVTNLSGLEEEIADSFSWLFAVSSKFRDLFSVFDSATGVTNTAAEMYIARHLVDRHMRDTDGAMICHECKASVCRCEIKLITDDADATALISSET